MVFLSSALQFSLTTLNLAKKTKADRLVVLCKSVASGHGRVKARQAVQRGVALGKAWATGGQAKSESARATLFNQRGTTNGSQD